ncbi:MAG: DUF2259 domain-containing protein [Treponema sp.]|nr:DUF2259 domain-containing protein [Treponema sp.]
MFNKKAVFIMALALLTVYGLFPGDTATFVDLGFSRDGRFYMFGQHGVQTNTLRPWADLFVVDVAQNNFVSNGRHTYIHENPVIAGQNGSGALNRLIVQNAPLAERHQIDYNFQGLPLFISLDNTDDSVSFRDFESGASYNATLVSFIEGSGESLRSSFFINLERTNRDGSNKSYIVGTPHFRRPQIASYRIQRVMVAPSDASMIFVIEMRRWEGESFSIRYMVEAVRL